MTPAEMKQVLEAFEAVWDWAKAVPQDTPLPAMPGYDGDAIAAAIALLRTALAAEMKQGTAGVGSDHA
jgi:hypothetical protein